MGAAVATTPRTPALDVTQGMTKLASYPFAVLTFVDDVGYPVSVALSATIVPVVLGIAIAARQGSVDLLTAALTVVGAAFVQLGLNVANDVFDSSLGADDANVTPTQFSGGSRVIQYGLVSFRQMASIATTFY